MFDRSLIALPEVLSSEERLSLTTSLTKIWTVTMGGAPQNLEHDLDACRRWFDPVAQGQRLRKELAALAETPEDAIGVDEPFVLIVGPGRRIVTPEGRCALDLLVHLPPDQLEYRINEDRLIQYDRVLANLYRTWSRHRITSVVALLAGTTKPLQVPAAGVVIALLVDGCTTEDRALVRYAAGPGREVVDDAFFNAVNAFADVLAPTRRGKRAQRLISGWMLYEARRRLGDSLVVVDARGGQDGRVWVRAEGEDDAIRVVARDLVRGHRARATIERFAEAFDALVAALRIELPKLAGFGMAHERPTQTAQLRARFIEALDVCLDSGDDAADLAS